MTLYRKRSVSKRVTLKFRYKMNFEKYVFPFRTSHDISTVFISLFHIEKNWPESLFPNYSKVLCLHFGVSAKGSTIWFTWYTHVLFVAGRTYFLSNHWILLSISIFVMKTINSHLLLFYDFLFKVSKCKSSLLLLNSDKNSPSHDIFFYWTRVTAKSKRNTDKLTMS